MSLRGSRCSSMVAVAALATCLVFCAPAVANASPWTGFNENDFPVSWQTSNFLTPAQLAQADRDQGATVDRTTIAWSGVEPDAADCEPGGNPNHCYWADLDAYYEALTGQQPGTYNPNITPAIRPLFTIIDVPSWAYDSTTQQKECAVEDQAYTETGMGATCSGWNQQAYANFAASVAKRYPYAAGIEIWNEENNLKKPQAGECYTGGTDSGPWIWCWGVQAYAQLLQDSYQAVHPLTQNGTVAPDMKVLLGSLSDVISTDSTNLSAGEWLADVYSAWNGQVYMDGIGLHPYPQTEGDAQQDSILDEVRDVRDAFNDSTRPIYVTETGISTASSSDPNTTPRPTEPVDEGEQALEIAHVWDALSPQPDIAAVLFHTIIDIGAVASNGSLIPEDGGYGLLDNNGDVVEPGVTNCGQCTGWDNSPYRVKPAFCTNAQLHASTGDGYQCPSSVSVPSQTAEPASGNWQAQIDLQAAYEVAREYLHQHASYAGITNAYLNAQNPTLLSASAPSNTSTNNPGSSANPSQIDIVTANATELQICNSGTGDTSYCTAVYPGAQPQGSHQTYTTLSGSQVTAAQPAYDEAVDPTSGDRAPLSASSGGWAPPTGY